MAKLALLAVLASLFGTVSCDFNFSSVYVGYGYRPPTPRLPRPRYPFPLPLSSHPPSPTPGLKVGYYAGRCPSAEHVVKDAVRKTTAGVQAGLVRLFFHDCFVEGCDASVLLNQVAGGPETEKQSFPNMGLRGFEVIDAAKDVLEAKCPGVVSCADIVAFAARDASNILSHGEITYQVPAGRFDGNVSLASETLGKNLPPPFGDLDLITAMFAAKGLSQTDMVVLSGAHSIGHSLCSSFPDRLPPPAIPTNTSMNPKLAETLNRTCSAGDYTTTTVPSDFRTPDLLDNQYYKNVLRGDVLFNSDAVLAASSETQRLVNFYAGNPSLHDFGFSLGATKWHQHFGQAMVKMGSIGVKSSTEGEIRKKCGFVNKP